jgi:uncharacterized protein YjiS (DUF1127 family)
MESLVTEIVVHLSNSAFGRARFAARLMRSLQRALIALSTRHALDALPDDLLRDIGVKRCDIPFVAVALASGEKHSTRDALDPLNQAVGEHGAAWRLRPVVLGLALVAAAAVSTFAIPSGAVGEKQGSGAFGPTAVHTSTR